MPDERFGVGASLLRGRTTGTFMGAASSSRT